MSAFYLSRAAPEDMLDVVDMMWKTFTSPSTFDTFMGTNTPEGRKLLADRYSTIMQENCADCWMKITDKETGTMVAVSNWRIHTSVVPEPYEDMSLPWLQHDKERLEQATARLTSIVNMRKRLWTRPHIQLNILGTNPAYARRGAGAMMMKWGCDLADQLFLPMWVEASIAGGKLYEAFGFVHYERKTWVEDGTVMRREVRTSPIEGGKLLTPETIKADEPKARTIS